MKKTQGRTVRSKLRTVPRFDSVRRLRHGAIAVAVFAALPVHAGNWLTSPVDDQWNNSANLDTLTVPSGDTTTAQFGPTGAIQYGPFGDPREEVGELAEAAESL